MTRPGIAPIVLPASLFEGADQFLSLLLRQSARAQNVVARAYGSGAWNQYSGRDLVAHVGRSSQNWLDVFPLNAAGSGGEGEQRVGRSLLFLGRNSYAGFVAALGALCAGVDVMFMPSQAGAADLEWCVQHFGCTALVTDGEEFVAHLGTLGLPVYEVGKHLWLPQDRHAEPDIFRLYRLFKTDPDVRVAYEQLGGVVSGQGAQDAGLRGLGALAAAWQGSRVGRLRFVSFGHDGFQKPEELAPDALVLTAQNFVIHLQPPPGLFWKTLEVVPPSNPFSHLSRFATLLRNGVVGFPNQASDWETNLRILRPTILFASSPELETVVSFVDRISLRPGFKARTAAGGRIDKARAMLASTRALRLPEAVFDAAGRALRVASRYAVGESFIEEAVGQLRCIVHGLSPAQESHVRCLERLGVPVIETYGVTAAAGLLSSNTFEAPHFNLIGSPLPHVSFRLGAQSLLEYKLSPSAFKGASSWQETGDVAQMTPFGFAITGRKKHLFVTAGGVTVSPVRLESLFKEHDIIADACIVGDKMPYLAALIVLSPKSFADFHASPEDVKERVQGIVTSVNETLSRFATIKKFVVLEKPFLEQDGEKLSSGALNRLKIYETRKALIENLYRNA